MIEATKKMGRPKKEHVKNERLMIRIYPEDKESLIKTSEKFNVTVSELIHIHAQICDKHLLGNKNKQEDNNGSTTG